MEETAKVLLDVFVLANAGKVETKLRELSNCNNEIRELEEEQAEVAGIKWDDKHYIRGFMIILRHESGLVIK